MNSQRYLLKSHAVLRMQKMLDPMFLTGESVQFLTQTLESHSYNSNCVNRKFLSQEFGYVGSTTIPGTSVLSMMTKMTPETQLMLFKGVFCRWQRSSMDTPFSSTESLQLRDRIVVWNQCFNTMLSTSSSWNQRSLAAVQERFVQDFLLSPLKNLSEVDEFRAKLNKLLTPSMQLCEAVPLVVPELEKLPWVAEVAAQLQEEHRAKEAALQNKRDAESVFEKQQKFAKDCAGWMAAVAQIEDIRTQVNFNEETWKSDVKMKQMQISTTLHERFKHVMFEELEKALPSVSTDLSAVVIGWVVHESIHILSFELLAQVRRVTGPGSVQQFEHVPLAPSKYVGMYIDTGSRSCHVVQ